MTQTITTTRTPHQGYNVNRGSRQNQGYAPGSAAQEQGYSPSSNAAPHHQEPILQNSSTAEIAPRADTSSQRQEYTPPNNTIVQRQGYASRNNIAPQYQESTRSVATPNNQEHVPRNNAGIRPVNQVDAQRVSMAQPSQGDLSLDPGSKAYYSPNYQDEDDAGLARRKSIPRKKLGTSASTPYSSGLASSPPRAQTGQSRQQNAHKPLPFTPAAISHGYTDRQTDPTPQPSSILNRPRPIPTSQTGLQDAQDIVERAKSNTYDTKVVETVAPGQSRS